MPIRRYSGGAPSDVFLRAYWPNAFAIIPSRKTTATRLVGITTNQKAFVSQNGFTALVRFPRLADVLMTDALGLSLCAVDVNVMPGQGFALGETIAARPDGWSNPVIVALTSGCALIHELRTLVVAPSRAPLVAIRRTAERWARRMTAQEPIRSGRLVSAPQGLLMK